jgi:hypothetical protein
MHLGGERRLTDRCKANKLKGTDTDGVCPLLISLGLILPLKNHPIRVL